MLRRLGWLWWSVARGLGAPGKATALVVLLPTVRLLGRLGLALDRAFSSRLRQTPLGPPVVIVGNPRSGTTFLQRFLVQHKVGCGREVWQMVYPSLAQQRLLRPLLPRLEAVSPVRYHTTAAHETSLTHVETDDATWIFRFTDGFFLYAFFLAWHDRDLLSEFDPAHRDTGPRDRAWLAQLWRRSQVAHGQDRVVAKVFSLGASTPAFQQAFPDARVLYLARDPVETIPSGMSLVTGVLDAAFGFWSLPKARRDRYLERLYQGLVLLLTRFTEDWRAGRIDRDKVMVVPFTRMMGDFEALMGEILDFVGYQPTEDLRRTIAERAAKQRGYQSGHRYSLERFGLDEDRIRTDCAAYIDTFLGAETPEQP